MTNNEFEKWLTLESLVAQTLKALFKLDHSVQQVFNIFKTSPKCLQLYGFDGFTMTTNFKTAFGLIKVMDIIVKDQLEAYSREYSLEESSKSEDQLVKAQQNIQPLVFAKKFDTDFENFSKANINEGPQFNLENDDSVESNDVNNFLNLKISPDRQQVSAIQTQLDELKDSLNKANHCKNHDLVHQLKEMKEEMVKLKAEKVQLSEGLNLTNSKFSCLEKELKSIREAAPHKLKEMTSEKDSLINKHNEKQADNLDFEGLKLSGKINISPEIESYKKNLKEILPFSYEGSKRIEWLLVSSSLIFGVQTTATFDKYGPSAIEASQNVLLNLVKSGTLISGLKIEKVKSIGVLDAEFIKLPFFTCCSNNKEVFNRPFFIGTQFIGLRFTYVKSCKQKFLAIEGDSSVDGKSADSIKGDQGEWVLELLGGNSVFLSHNTKEGKNVLAINDAGDAYLTASRAREYHEEFEIKYHQNERVVTFQRVRSPKFYLSCDEHGKVRGHAHFNLLGNEGWKIE